MSKKTHKKGHSRPGAEDPDHPTGEQQPAGAKSTERPLDGIRVLDVGNFVSGPYAASVLSEFGAEVIKIEYPVGGDPMRIMGTPTAREDSTLFWLTEARNRKSVTLNLREPEGAELFRRLVAKCDVVVESFRPGTMESWGLGWDVLHGVNPGLVMLRVTGYGQTGPYKDHRGFSHLAHAFGGLAYLCGFPGQAPTIPGPNPLADYMVSLYGVIGILLALRHRKKTGRGQYIDIGSYEAVFRQLDEMASAYGAFGKIREREGSGTVIACPHGHFRTLDDKWVAIACTSDKMFARLAEGAMDKPELASDSAYGLKQKRLEAREEVDQIVGEWTASMTRDELIEKALAADVPIGALNSIEDIFADPHFRARENLVTLTDPDIGEVTVPGVIPRLSETPGRIENLGPPLGNMTEQVLRELLGLSREEIASLHCTRSV
ncbi:CoA transferase [Pseudohaliea sp.]|uniref:CaiB/BaiF CoA transferase family protein n=1 Tax=Pseudohaliea sp. TaxID=2740289 RepID=UPI0032F06509